MNLTKSAAYAAVLVICGAIVLIGSMTTVDAAEQCVYTPNSLKALTSPKEPLPGTPTDDKVTDKPAKRPSFAYHPPGRLHQSGKRKGYTGRKVFLPDIIFPLKLPTGMHPHLNSQIYGRGGGGWGGKGKAGGGECDLKNYNPLKNHDNFCEVRRWNMPFCPAGSGHQGLDIRPPSCKDARWPIVAVADGIITRVRKNSTSIVQKGKDGTIYNYLHMHPRSITVRTGQSVKQGDVIGKVSKWMGGKRQTTLHLHFAASQTVRIKGKTRRVYIPIYSSLIAALRRAKGLGRSTDQNGDLIEDAKFEIGVKPDPKPTDPKPTDPKPTDPEADQLAEAKRKITSLEQQLDALKVDSQRKIDAAEGQAKDLRISLKQAQEKIDATEEIVEQLRDRLAQQEQNANKQEAQLRAIIDEANAALKTNGDRIAKLEAQLKEKTLWQRTKRWWKSLGSDVATN